MKKFEVGKIYRDEDGVEIEVIKRTEKTITFKFTKKNWFEKNIEKTYRKKIQKFHNDFESIEFGDCWSSPSIYAL